MANDVEITVRVSNQTANGLTGVTQALNRLKAKAQDATQAITGLRASLATSAELEVKLDDQTAAGIAAIQAGLATLRAESPLEIRAEFTGDAAEITASAAALQSLRTNGGHANTTLSALTTRAAAAALALAALDAAASDAADSLNRLDDRATAARTSLGALRAETAGHNNVLRTMNTRLSTSETRMEALSTRTHTLRTDINSLDDSARRLGGSLSGLRGRFGSVESSAGNAAGGMQNLMKVAIALAPALVPIAAAAAPLVPALGAAGAAMLAFGAAALPQIMKLGALSKAETNYRDAVEQHGRSSKQAAAAEAAWLEEVSKSSPEVRKGAAAMQVMTEQYKAWNTSLAGDTLPVATKAFGVLGAVFPRLTPLVKGASVELNRLMNMLAVGVQSHGFDEFIVKMADFSQRTLRAAIDGIVDFGQAMNRGIQGDGFREFLAYVRESGPIVAETLGQLMRALMKIVVAASDTGIGVLTLVNAFARLVNAVPTELLSVLLQMAFAFKALQLVSVALGPALMSAAAGASNFVRAARFGGVAAAVQGVTQSLTAMQRASIVLAVLTAVVVGINALADKAKGAPPDVDRLATSLKNLGKAGDFSGELKKTFSDMDGFIAKVNNMKTSTESFDRMKAFTSLVPMGSAIDKVAEKIDNLKRGTYSLTAMQDQFKALDAAFSNLARSGHADEAATQFAGFDEALRSAGYTTKEIAAIFPQYQAAVASLAADQEMAARSMGFFGEQAIAVQAKLNLQKQSAEGLRQSINSLNNAYLEARGGVRGMEAAIDEATESLKKNGRTLDENTEKGRANNQALDNLAAATMKAVEATLANGAGWEAAQAVWERGRGQLLASAQAMGLTEAQARALANQILATPDKTAVLRGNMEDLQAKLNSSKAQLATVPDSRKAQVRADISQLEGQIAEAQAQLAGMRKNYTVWIHYQTTGSPYLPSGGREYAHGGVIGAAGGGPRSRMTLVGEQGPELVDLAPGSRVRSNPDSKRIAAGMAGGGGEQRIVLEFRSSGSPRDDYLVEEVRKAVSARGGDVQLVLGNRRTT